jgi:hypothetical protein
MNAAAFDLLTRLLASSASRRWFLGSLAAAALSIAPATRLSTASAKKKKKLQFNQFGCVNVGGKCRGKDAKCCSGICQGKKPKKGKKDKSRCVAHNTGGCLAAEQSCGPSPDVPCGAGGFCLATTGNAGFCGTVSAAACAACRKDEDCQGAFGSGAACVICANGACPETGDRACVPAAA